jgi:hypothetical protein
MKLLKELRVRIEDATLQYEAAEELSEHFAGLAIEAWDDMTEAYDAEFRELNRIDIEGE